MPSLVAARQPGTGISLQRFALPGLLLFSFLIRFWLIGWGIGLFWFDARIFHPDEPKVVRYVDRFPDSMKENYDFRYPTGLHHILIRRIDPVSLPIEFKGDAFFVYDRISPAQARFP